MIVVSPYRSVYENLAFEDLLFDSYGGQSHHLLLYIDEPTVVMGRFQNPWREMNLRLMKERGIPPARRVSGGGCVYHDTGNLNFSVFMPRADFSREGTVGAVIEVLAGLGIDARTNCRHDILVDGCKVSGSAYRLVKGKAYHHGTLLVNADLDTVGSLLVPSYDGIESSGTPSVASPVTNLSAYSPGVSVGRLIDAFSSCDAFLDKRSGGGLEIPGSPQVAARARELASAAWIFGKTPEFILREGTAAYRFPKGQLPSDDGFSLPLDDAERLSAD